MLNELDRKLEARGLRFTRYVENCMITARSESSDERVEKVYLNQVVKKIVPAWKFVVKYKKDENKKEGKVDARLLSGA